MTDAAPQARRKPLAPQRRSDVLVTVQHGDGRTESVRKPLGAAHAYVARFNRFAAETGIDSRATIAC